MLSVTDLARCKRQIPPELLQREDDFAYDHVSQVGRRKLDRDVFRISMKSDTMFDRESDPSDEK